MSYSQYLRSLKNKHFLSVCEDFERLLCSHLKINKAFLITNFEKLKPQISKLEFHLESLSSGVPLAHIIGEVEFYGLSLNINKNCLIPRPETEFLVELICKDFKKQKSLVFADLGSGSGCIGISLVKNLHVQKAFFTEVEMATLNILKENIKLNLVDKTQVELFLNSSDCEEKLIIELQNKNITLDFLVSNPPYIEIGDKAVSASVLQYEPHRALFSSHKGLSHLQTWSKKYKAFIKKGGYMIFETGHQQESPLRLYSEQMGWSCEFIKDQYGVNRFWKINV